MSIKKSFYVSALLLALPNIVQALVTNLSQMIDNLMVGQLNEIAIAGVSITNQIFFVFTILCLGLGATGGIFITQYKGAFKYDKITQVFRVEILFALFVGFLFFLLMNFFPENVYHLFVREKETVDGALEYLQYIKFTFLIFPISVIIASALRYNGYVKIPMYVSILIVIMNIFLNYCLIYGNLGFPAMGVAGAGLGTFIVRIIELTIYIVLTLRLKTPIKLSIRKMFRFEKYILSDYLKKGYGLVSNELLWSLGLQVATIIYTQRISENVAAYSIANVMIDLTFIGMGGMSVAISIIVGKHLGRDEFNKAKVAVKKLIKLSVFVGVVLGLFAATIATVILNLYNVSPHISQMARLLIYTTAGFSWLYYLNAGMFFVLRSGGDTKSVLIMDSGFMWVISIPFIYFTGHFFAYMPLHFFVVQCLDLVKFLIARYRYKREKWLVNLTIHNVVD